MERDFQSILVGGEDNGGYSPVFAADDTCIDGVYSGMSFLSLLGVNQDRTLMPSLDYAYAASSIEPASFGFVTDFPAIQSNQLGEGLTDVDRKMKSIDFMEEMKLKMPKHEPLNNEEFNVVSTEPFNFISKSSDPISSLCDSMFHQLPDLRSLEHVHDRFAVAESSRKRVKSFSPPNTEPYTLESIVRNFQISNYFAADKAPEVRAPRVPPQSVLARQRRQKISDKTRCLQKLLPWDKKMDMATMLEEAYKYIKFLQAQISILQSMPCNSSSFATQNPRNVNLFGGLGRLNRQQLLQVLMNSPVAQTVLYSQGCCVYSIEQLVLLQKIAESKVVYQQIAFDP